WRQIPITISPRARNAYSFLCILRNFRARQRRYGKLLQYAEVRVLLSEPLREHRTASDRYPPLHPLLQSRTHQNKTKLKGLSPVQYRTQALVCCLINFDANNIELG